MVSPQDPSWHYSGEEIKDLNWKEFGNALLNASPYGIAVFDHTFQALISNNTGRNDLLIYPGSLLETTLPDLKIPAQRVLDTQRPERNLIVKTENNSFSATLNPIFLHHKAVGVMILFEDMTALEKMTDKMVSYQELSIELDTIIDSSYDGLWICDGQGYILRVNPASEKLTELKAEDVIGRNMTELVEEGIIDKSVTLEVLKTKEKTSIIQKTGKGKKLFLTGSPVFDQNGELFRVVVNERDITDITKLQQKLEEKSQLTARYKRDLLEQQIYETESRRIIGNSANFMNILQKAVKLGEVDSTVLILGESGTGKGVMADLIHKYSSRADHPMIKINCGSIPDSLVESELFGYEKGAFTGAGQKGKPGKFEIADKGIIFLDEIAELPLASQVKLLKFLEDGVITRVGSTKNKQVDVRIIAATNQDLKKMIESRHFRDDLYYRLNVVPLKIPPLRDRKECIIPLINHYIGKFCKKYKKKPLIFSSDVLDALSGYSYPGNVREMINICERLVVMSQAGAISFKDLPGSVRKSSFPGIRSMDNWAPGKTLKTMVEQYEKNILTLVLKKSRTQSNAAKELGLNQSTIARKLKKYGLV